MIADDDGRTEEIRVQVSVGMAIVGTVREGNVTLYALQFGHWIGGSEWISLWIFL